MLRWLSSIDGFAEAAIAPASSDASFRRYFRTVSGDASYVVMDAPPRNEDSSRFVTIAGFLRAMSLNVPQIVHADLQQGFLLLSDLGSQQYLDELTRHPGRASALYKDAINALLTLQRSGRAYQSELPPYDETLLRFELSIFKEWLCERHLGIEFVAQELRQWEKCCDLLVQNALNQQRVFVHRDYHSRNLMLTAENNPGILDFQDALEGPLTYDLVSLLKDCYVSWPEETVRKRALDFHGQLGDGDRDAMSADEFMYRFELTGAQRHLKAAGIFARLLHRDQKSAYLDDIPRTLNYVAALAPRHQDLQFVTQLVVDRCIPMLRELAT